MGAFVENLKSVWTSMNDYERRVAELMNAIHVTISSPLSDTLPTTYAALKAAAAEFRIYKQTTKREWVAQKSDIAGLLGNIVTKLKTYNLRTYIPPAGLTLEVSHVPELPDHLAKRGSGSRRMLASLIGRGGSTNTVYQCSSSRVRIYGLFIEWTPIDANVRETRRIKENLRLRFARLANDFEGNLQSLASQLAALEGDLTVS